jgi:hypothetical protein
VASVNRSDGVQPRGAGTRCCASETAPVSSLLVTRAGIRCEWRQWGRKPTSAVNRSFCSAATQTPGPGSERSLRSSGNRSAQTRNPSVLQDFLGTALNAITVPSCMRCHRGYSKQYRNILDCVAERGPGGAANGGDDEERAAAMKANPNAKKTKPGQGRWCPIARTAG